MLCLKFTGCVANIVNPDETPRSGVSSVWSSQSVRISTSNTVYKSVRILGLIYILVGGSEESRDSS